MSDKYLKVKDNGEGNLELIRESIDDARDALGVSALNDALDGVTGGTQNLYAGADLEFVKGSGYIDIGTWLQYNHTYTFSADVASDDTDAEKCRIYISRDGVQGSLAFNIDRGEHVSVTFTITSEYGNNQFYAYASTSSADSEGDTATFSNIQIEENEIASDYTPNRTAVDYVRRELSEKLEGIYSTTLENIFATKNALNYLTIIPDKRIKADTGAVVDATNQDITDFIPVIPGTIATTNVYLKSASYGYALYDIYKKYVSSAPSNAASMSIHIPDGVYYIRYTINKTDLEEGPNKAVVNIVYSVSENYSGEVVEKTKWLAVGDSITLGIYSYGADQEAKTDSCWVKLLAKSLGYDVTVMASRGMGYSADVKGKDPDPDPLDPDPPRISLDTLLTRIEDMTDDFNLITLAFGINDYAEPSHSTLDTIEAGVDDAIERLSTKFPNARLVVITPFNSSRQGDASTNYAYNSSFGKSGIPESYKTLKQVADRIQERCQAYGAECVYATNGFLLTVYNILSLLPDNTHPSLDGHKLIAKTMAHILWY